MAKRVVYIDALRGLAMLLVVMVHIEGFGLFVEEFHISIFRRLCEAIMLPLFFFISGCVAKSLTFRDLIKSLLRLVIPALLMGVIHSLYIQKDIISFLCNIYKYGYWFTITLSEMLFVLYVIIKVAKNRIHKITRILIIISCVLYAIKVPFNSSLILDRIGDMFCFHQLFLYFQYFSIGYILSSFKDFYSKLLNSEFIILSSIVVFGVVFYIKCTYSDEQLAISIPLKIYRFVQDPILGYTGIILLVRYFLSIESLLSSTLLGKVLCMIGRHTFEIYLLHYFLLPHIPVIGMYLIHYPNLILEVLVSLFLSIIVIYLTIIVSWCIRFNSILGFLLLGSKLKYKRIDDCCN